MNTIRYIGVFNIKDFQKKLEEAKQNNRCTDKIYNVNMIGELGAMITLSFREMIQNTGTIWSCEFFPKIKQTSSEVFLDKNYLPYKKVNLEGKIMPQYLKYEQHFNETTVFKDEDITKAYKGKRIPKELISEFKSVYISTLEFLSNIKADLSQNKKVRGVFLSILDTYEANLSPEHFDEGFCFYKFWKQNYFNEEKAEELSKKCLAKIDKFSNKKIKEKIAEFLKPWEERGFVRGETIIEEKIEE